MDLQRDLFTVTAESDGPTDEEMVAAVAETGFEATVRRPEDVADAAPPQPRTGALPSVVQEALERARREEKLVLLDFYADWCGPCKRMSAVTYKDAQVVSELAHVVFLKIDTDELPEAARYFAVGGLPDARVLNADGTEVASFVGFRDAGEVVRILRAARGADEEKQ